MRAFDDLGRSGKVRYVGLSDVPSWYASRAQTLAEWRGYEPVAALQLEYSLVERAIEHEFVTLGTEYGMGITVWSPLASGLLSGKYRASAAGLEGTGRFATMKNSPNPVFGKLHQARNWQIVAALESVARELGRSMAQVAINWVANRPGVASVLVGATRPEQLNDNLGALDFDLPAALVRRLEDASAPASSFPYVFFGDEVQSIIAGGTRVGGKPPAYSRSVETSGTGGSLIE